MPVCSSRVEIGDRKNRRKGNCILEFPPLLGEEGNESTLELSGLTPLDVSITLLHSIQKTHLQNLSQLRYQSNPARNNRDKRNVLNEGIVNNIIMQAYIYTHTYIQTIHKLLEKYEGYTVKEMEKKEKYLKEKVRE